METTHLSDFTQDKAKPNTLETEGLYADWY